MDRFGMTRAPATDIFIRRVFRCSACVTGSRMFDSLDLLKRRLNAPESTSGKNSFVQTALFWKFGNRRISKHCLAHHDAEYDN